MGAPGLRRRRAVWSTRDARLLMFIHSGGNRSDVSRLDGTGRHAVGRIGEVGDDRAPLFSIAMSMSLELELG